MYTHTKSHRAFKLCRCDADGCCVCADENWKSAHWKSEKCSHSLSFAHIFFLLFDKEASCGGCERAMASSRHTLCIYIYYIQLLFREKEMERVVVVQLHIICTWERSRNVAHRIVLLFATRSAYSRRTWHDGRCAYELKSRNTHT